MQPKRCRDSSKIVKWKLKVNLFKHYLLIIINNKNCQTKAGTESMTNSKHEKLLGL